MTIDLFEGEAWQMSFGERAAVEGVLQAVKPKLAIEIGSAEGASLRRIALHSAEVHSFDLVAPPADDLPAHVHLHPGDSHVLLPHFLSQLAQDGRNVDFVMVDGDHSTAGVQRDMEDLLRSPAIGETVILAHDIANELVRAGLDAVAYDAYPKVAHVDLDFVPGYMGQDRFSGELWGGLGLVVVDAGRPAYGSTPVVQTVRHHGGELLAIARDVLSGQAPEVGGLAARVAQLERRAADLEALAEHHRGVVQDLTTSASWRLTAPLRAAKRATKRP